MGRKIDMKKIEDITKCQVTFSKRRSSLIKKAQEISVCCDVDVAFVAFSPSGRISKFCSQKRIEDVLLRFVNLPADRRINHIQNVQEKQEKLRQLHHIKGDSSKLQYLDKQIENLELQIKKSTLELQILEADLRDYEPGPEQEPSLHQLSWCERNLEQSLQRVMARKKALYGSLSSSYMRPCSQMDLMEMESQGGMPLINSSAQNPSPGQLLLQLDPWISPYSAKVRESIFQDLLDQAKRKSSASDQVQESSSNRATNLPILDLPSSMTDIQQNYNLTQSGTNPSPPIFFNQQAGVLESSSLGIIGANGPLGVQQHSPHTFGHHEGMGAEQNASFGSISNGEHLNRFGGGIHNNSRSARGSQPLNLDMIGSAIVNAPFSTTTTSIATTATRNGKGLCLNQTNMDCSKNNSHNNNNDDDNNNDNNNDNGRGHGNEHYSPAMDQVVPPQGVPNGSFDNLPMQEDFEDNTFWTTGIQRSGMWEWDDLIFADNLNLEGLDI